jgi:ATP-binding protein involved in chromosome partitioning
VKNSNFNMVLQRLISKRFLSASAGGGKKSLDQHQKELMSRGLPKKRSLAGVDHVLLVASGKGGVGKSTTAVNIALAMSAAPNNLNIGVLDADVYGPSIPIMLNVCEKPLVCEETNKMLPLSNYGIKCMSMGFLVADENSAIVWRGPMVMGALDKMVHGTAWSPLDVLVVDLPPGTGDVQLSLAQTLDISGSVMVTTPQKVALSDARRGATMFEKVDIPVLGVVENMSGFVCAQCNAVTDVFGSGLGLVDAMAKELNAPLLGRVPLDADIVRTCDDGKPIVISRPDSNCANIYKEIADKIIRDLGIKS